MRERDRATRAIGNSGASLPGPYLDGTDSANLRGYDRRLRFVSEGAGISGNSSQQPTWRRTKDRVHEEPSGGIRKSGRTLPDSERRAARRRGIPWLYRDVQVAESRRNFDAHWSRIETGLARPKRSGAPHP